MKLFDVYPINPINIVKGVGSLVYDDKGTEYLDLYGGHAVISIGHTNPHYVKRLEDQLHRIGFYSNSIEIPLQKELAEKLEQKREEWEERLENQKRIQSIQNDSLEQHK